MAGMVTVATGHWGKTAWTLSASESNGMYCSGASLDGTPLGAGCTGINQATRAHLLMYGSSWSALAPTAIVRGMVAARATRVVITLANGQKIRMATIPPPAGLARDIGFFIAPFPCGTYPASAIALDGHGRVVASWPPAGFPSSALEHSPPCGPVR